jgi:hypothetical protein
LSANLFAVIIEKLFASENVIMTEPASIRSPRVSLAQYQYRVDFTAPIEAAANYALVIADV